MRVPLTILIVTISLIAGFIYGCCENTSGTVVLKSGEVLEATRITHGNGSYYQITYKNKFGDYETDAFETSTIAEIRYNRNNKKDSTITNDNPTKFEDYSKWD